MCVRGVGGGGVVKARLPKKIDSGNFSEKPLKSFAQMFPGLSGFLRQNFSRPGLILIFVFLWL